MALAKQRIDKAFSCMSSDLYTYYFIFFRLQKGSPLLNTEVFRGTPFLRGVIEIKEGGVPVFRTITTSRLTKGPFLLTKAWTKK